MSIKNIIRSISFYQISALSDWWHVAEEGMDNQP